MRYIALTFLLVIHFSLIAKERFKIADDKIFNRASTEFIIIKDRKTDTFYFYPRSKELGGQVHENITDFMIWNIPIKAKFKDGKIVDARTYVKNWIDIE